MRINLLQPVDAHCNSNRRAFWRSPLFRLICFVCSVKIVLLVYAAIAQAVQQDQSLEHLRAALDLWRRWDAPHYLTLAERGYASTGDHRFFIVFFPLFPWLIRLVEPVTGDYYYAALLISTAASLACCVLLYRLVRLEFGEEIAERTTLLLFVFPTSYFLHIAYTESLFLALCIGSIYASRTGGWKLAGILGMFAATTRINGSILFPVLVFEAWRQWRENGRSPRQAWPVFLVPLGVFVYLALNLSVYGTPWQFMEYQREHWYRSLAPPWQGLWDGWSTLRRNEVSIRQMAGVQELVFSALAIGAMVASLFWLRGTYALWMGGNLLLCLSTTYLQSMPRYCLVMFPIMMIAARLVRTQAAWTLVIVVCVLMLALFSAQFSSGRWAF